MNELQIRCIYYAFQVYSERKIQIAAKHKNSPDKSTNPNETITSCIHIRLFYKLRRNISYKSN